MGQRKQYLIDKKLQLRTTFSVIGIVAIITAVIILAIGVNIANNNEKIENILEIQDNIVHFLTYKTMSSGQDEAYSKAIKDISANHTNNMETLKGMINYNRILLLVIFLLVIIETIVLYVLLIRRTHRISGPVYVMSNYMKDIIDGKFPELRPLRDKDELKGFYSIFKEMIQVLKEREQKK